MRMADDSNVNPTLASSRHPLHLDYPRPFGKRTYMLVRLLWMQSWWQWSRRTILVVACVPLAACIPIRSGPEMVGTYRLAVAHQKITLELESAGTFTEIIQYESGKIERRAGRWNWTSDRVDLSDLWIPRSFAPDYILQADAEAKVSQQKLYGALVLGDPRRKPLGTTILPSFPDAGTNFENISSPRH